jgi:hypothetical protein
MKRKQFILTCLSLGLSIMFPLAATSAQTSFSVWPDTRVPGIADAGADSPVEVGVKFRADSSGTITGIRFYKSAKNTGTHVANLWTRGGTRLASATFKNETASGWQQVNFASPVAISANTVYIASYHTNSGHYSCDENYFSSSGVDSAPLHIFANGVSGVNGVYGYGSTSKLPNLGWRSSNYWVDVVFSTTATADTTPPSVTAFSIPSTSTTLTVPINSLSATDNVGVTGFLVNESASAPASNASGWSPSVPASYTFAAAGSKTLYAWARDAGGNVSSSRSAGVTITLQTSGPEPAGWYAGDMHVHRSCGGAPEAVSSIFQKMNAQDLAAISLMADMGNGEVKDPYTDLPRVNGQDDPVSTLGRILHWEAEWHWDATYGQYQYQALGGHVLALGLLESHQIWEEYTYPIFKWVHQQNGIAGFAHMQYLDGGIPQTLNCCMPIEYPVEVALGASDFISEDVDDNNYSGPVMYPENAIQAYYRLLNCGFRPGLAAGTDYPCNYSAPLGSLLTYAQVDGGQMTYRNWIEGIAKGRTVISRNGHKEFLDLKVNNSATPGDEINLSEAGNVQVTIQWTAAQGLTGVIELIQNGVVVASKQASAGQGSPASLSATVNFSRSGWLAARRMGDNGHMLHTAAVFVLVNNAPVRASQADALFYVGWMDNLLAKTSPGGAWSSYLVNSRAAAQARYQSARAIFQQIALEAGETPAEPTIFTNQTPSTYENDAAYELGTKFRADVSGQITKVRIYTNTLEGGDHIVRIWRVSDASVVAGPYTWNFMKGTSGWHIFTLPVPLAIAANTEYIVAVSNSSDRYYSEQSRGFDVPIVNGHLNTSVGSGVYTDKMGAMPASTWQNTNYFRDVYFEPLK